MYTVDQRFGIQVFGHTLGEAWISLVEAVASEGVVCLDEHRQRRAIDNVRLRAATQSSADYDIAAFGDANNLATMLDLTFKEPVMHDLDITPSFSPGAKSYYRRVQEGALFDFVVQRLTAIPESKKAVIVFPTHDDYKQVLENMKDDYLPCLVSIQFRLVKDASIMRLNTTFNSRSMDVYQKGHGNLVSIAKITEILSERIGKNLGLEIRPGFLDGLIVDAHIYENTLSAASDMIAAYHNSKGRGCSSSR